MPVGIQDFEKLRTEDCVYVDKTQYATSCLPTWGNLCKRR